MMRNFYLVLSLILLTTTLSSQTIAGTIKGDNSETLIGASILVLGTSTGTVTDEQGQFSLNYSGAFPISIEVAYTGYATQIIELEAANTTLSIEMEEGFILGQEVVISASRRAEKLQEAPSAVSIISSEDVSASGGAVSPIRALINTPGVELQQQTGQRINLALRGSSGVFATNVFPMLDYRSLISPGLEFFDSQNSPINNIDIERIEVVLGPGSALYGPDVTTGVVHFISKDPFRHPGTTVELVYGEMNTLKTSLRHAGHSEDGKFGYKLNARYGSGQDFALDPNDPDDQIVLSNFQEVIRRGVITPEGAVNPQADGPTLLTTGQLQDPDYWAAAVNGSLYFRPSDETELVAAGGWNAGSSIFYNELGEGFSSSAEGWGQVRLNHKGLFAQMYYITNNGGTDNNPTYLNRTGLIAPLRRSHFESQLQYNFR
ncbi:MAG: carboxypeptidase-like regulatory domain-containing protein, partial [Bacteroidota bacterium]